MGTTNPKQSLVQAYVWTYQKKALEKIASTDSEKWNWKGERPTVSKHVRRAVDLYLENLPPAYKKQLGLKLEKNSSK